ncbi:MAG: hypothetical protein D6702_06460 [Planctomycetota bacterium]|nr:MAG: hypothetical protein D6702_06460 [Planctomycetota bacterium]
MNHPRLALLLAATAVAAAPSAGAQEPGVTRVEARVTSASPGRVSLDRGRDAGAEPGDRVRILEIGAPPRDGRVETVSERDCIVRLDDPAAEVEIGSRAEILVPSDRLAARAAEQGAAGGERRHPGWSRAPDEWSQDMPLLAKSKGRKPEERPAEWHGRAYAGFDLTDDRQGGGRRYLLARSGADLEAANPFGRGGRLDIDFEINHRSDYQRSGDTVSDTTLRLDRLAWTVGGDRHRPARLAFGRFLPEDLPEFGILDGTEVSYGLSPENRVGASLGFLPEFGRELATGKDLQTAAFVSHRSGDGAFRAAGGFQKTWHEGTADRDLLVGKIGWSPPTGFNLYSTAWVDFYDSTDTAKSTGPELTQFYGAAGWRSEKGNGFRLGLSRIRFPQTLRAQLSDVTLSQLADNQTDRVDLSAWRRLTPDLRLSAGLDHWSDEDGSGGGGRLRADWRDPLFAGGDLGLTLAFNQGQFHEVASARLDADWETSLGAWRLAWETARQKQIDFVGSQETLLQHLFQLSWDLAGASGWASSAYLEQRLGDEQDSLTLGLYLQYRF